MLPGRKLVVDTSVARAAGQQDSASPRGARCRGCLDLVTSAGHQLVWSPRIREEWHKKRENGSYYASKYALDWLQLMLKKGRLFRPEEAPSLEDALRETSTTDKAKIAMVEDVHLIDAALASDRVVLSLDEEVRGCFRAVVDEVEPLRKVAWANPLRDEEAVLEWLRDGAKPQAERELGHRPPG